MPNITKASNIKARNISKIILERSVPPDHNCHMTVVISHSMTIQRIKRFKGSHYLFIIRFRLFCCRLKPMEINVGYRFISHQEFWAASFTDIPPPPPPRREGTNFVFEMNNTQSLVSTGNSGAARNFYWGQKVLGSGAPPQEIFSLTTPSTLAINMTFIGWDQDK